MKSKLIKGPKIENLEFKPEQLSLRIPMEEINQYITEEFSRIAKTYGEIVELGTDEAVDLGDIVQVKLESSIDKYNKTIPLNVGRGLFNKEIEAAIVGMKLGENKTVELSDGTVKLTLVNAKTKRIPTITAEMLEKEFGEYFPDAHTVEEFEAGLRAERIEDYKYDHYFTEAANDIGEVIVQQIELDIDEEEYQHFKNQLMNSLVEEAEADNIPLEVHLRDVFDDQADPQSEIDVEALYAKVEKTIKRDFIFMVYAVDSLKDTMPPSSIEEYEASVEEWAMSMEKEKEEIRQMMSYKEFVERNYVGELQNQILDKFYTNLTIEMV